MIPLEVGNLDGIVILFVVIMFGPPALLTFVGFMVRKHNRKTAKVFYILAAVYLIAGLGICGSML